MSHVSHSHHSVDLHSTNHTSPQNPFPTNFGSTSLSHHSVDLGSLSSSSPRDGSFNDFHGVNMFIRFQKNRSLMASFGHVCGILRRCELELPKFKSNKLGHVSHNHHFIECVVWA